jgi:serine O-acetyltransferase
MKRSAVGRYHSLSRGLYLKNIPLIPHLLQKISRIIFSCDIPYVADIHHTVRFGHNGLGVVIHPKTSIGKNSLIMHNVTLGGNVSKKRTHEGKEFSYPIIGENVFIGPGSTILGPIIVGDNAQIGAGAVVLKDVPKNAIVGGIPANIIKILDETQVFQIDQWK